MQEKNQRRSNARRTVETRSALISAARALFAKKGFAETSTPGIVKAAKVTRGALYHHFEDKTDLFRAVVQAEAEAVAFEIETNTPGDLAPLEALIEGGAAYFAAMSVPGRARIMLVDGPAVLGHVEIQKIDRKTGGEELRRGLLQLIPQGQPDMPVAVLVDLLSAMFDRAALAIAIGENPAPYKAAIDKVLRGLTN